MVNQRFWGRECRQVLGHLQPPQMSLEEIGCSFEMLRILELLEASLWI